MTVSIHNEYNINPAFWSKRYREISVALSLDPEKDREATAMLHNLIEPRKSELDSLLHCLEKLIRSRKAFIFGCGPSLDTHMDEVAGLLRGLETPKIAADGATSALLEAGVRPDIIVTDLDGDVQDIAIASGEGAIVILHSHGDNMDTVSRWLPNLHNVFPVTQTEPTALVHNFGGFTDGDKCLYLAAAFQATCVVLIGMDFGSEAGPRSDPCRSKSTSRDLKAAKLEIGKRLSEELLRKTLLPAYSLPPASISGSAEITFEGIRSLLGG